MFDSKLIELLLNKNNDNIGVEKTFKNLLIEKGFKEKEKISKGNSIITNYDDYLREEIDNTIKDHIENFCKSSDSADNIITYLCNGEYDNIKNRINASLCTSDVSIDQDDQDKICGRFQSTDDMKMCKNADGDELVDITIDCEFTTTTTSETTTTNQ